VSRKISIDNLFRDKETLVSREIKALKEYKQCSLHRDVPLMSKKYIPSFLFVGKELFLNPVITTKEIYS